MKSIYNNTILKTISFKYYEYLVRSYNFLYLKMFFLFEYIL